MNKCENCGKYFKAKPTTKGRFCSRSCYWKSLRGIPIKADNHGRTPWNKGKKIPQISGEKHWCYGKKRPEISGKNHYTHGVGRPEMRRDNHPNWSGDDIGYGGVHAWIKKELGSPSICEKCGKSELNTKKIHWANKSGKYLRKKEDWFRLCINCHWKYDKPWLSYKLPSTNKSGYRGVCFNKSKKRWQATISGKFIGRYKIKEEAARAYDKEAKKLWGKMAVLNFA